MVFVVFSTLCSAKTHTFVRSCFFWSRSPLEYSNKASRLKSASVDEADPQEVQQPGALPPGGCPTLQLQQPCANESIKHPTETRETTNQGASSSFFWAGPPKNMFFPVGFPPQFTIIVVLLYIYIYIWGGPLKQPHQNMGFFFAALGQDSGMFRMGFGGCYCGYLGLFEVSVPFLGGFKGNKNN